MNGARQKLGGAHTHDGRTSHNFNTPAAQLSQLWKLFEESGTISAYIAYRMCLANLIYADRQHVMHWRSGL
jgi:hypothetical protein